MAIMPIEIPQAVNPAERLAEITQNARNRLQMARSGGGGYGGGGGGGGYARQPARAIRMPVARQARETPEQRLSYQERLATLKAAMKELREEEKEQKELAERKKHIIRMLTPFIGKKYTTENGKTFTIDSPVETIEWMKDAGIPFNRQDVVDIYAQFESPEIQKIMKEKKLTGEVELYGEPITQAPPGTRARGYDIYGRPTGYEPISATEQAHIQARTERELAEAYPMGYYTAGGGKPMQRMAGARELAQVPEGMEPVSMTRGGVTYRKPTAGKFVSEILTDKETGEKQIWERNMETGKWRRGVMEDEETPETAPETTPVSPPPQRKSVGVSDLLADIGSAMATGRGFAENVPIPTESNIPEPSFTVQPTAMPTDITDMVDIFKSGRRYRIPRANLPQALKRGGQLAQ